MAGDRDLADKTAFAYLFDDRSGHHVHTADLDTNTLNNMAYQVDNRWDEFNDEPDDLAWYEPYKTADERLRDQARSLGQNVELEYGLGDTPMFVDDPYLYGSEQSIPNAASGEVEDCTIIAEVDDTDYIPRQRIR